MRFFSKFFATSKDKEIDESENEAIVDSETKNTVSVISKKTEKKAVKLAKKELKQILSQMNELIIKVGADGSNTLIQIGEKVHWYAGRPVLNVIIMKDDRLVDYLGVFDESRNSNFHFEGKFDVVKKLLMSIGTEWFHKQNSVSINITDKIYDIGMNERHAWKQFILSISRNINEAKLLRDTLPKEYYKQPNFECDTQPNLFRREVIWKGMCLRTFEIRCEPMDIYRYDALREDIVHMKTEINFHPKDLPLLKRMLRQEADAQKNNDKTVNKFDFEEILEKINSGGLTFGFM